jgi:hypothetical protein
MKRKLLIALAMLILFFANGKAQSDSSFLKTSKHFQTIGGLVGWGNSFSKNTNYQVYYFMFDYSRSFKIPKKKDFFAWYAEPQFNLVTDSYTPKSEINRDYEFGLNLGLRNYVKINDGFYFYQMLGSGPHYISAKVGRQASGFIFSDNLAVGTLFRLAQQHILVNVQYVQRHISNANLKSPNGGVNSYNFMVGLSRIK